MMSRINTTCNTDMPNATQFSQIWIGHDEAINPQVAKLIVLSKNTCCYIGTITPMAFTTTSCWCPDPQSNTPHQFPVYLSLERTARWLLASVHLASLMPTGSGNREQQQIHYAKHPVKEHRESRLSDTTDAHANQAVQILDRPPDLAAPNPPHEQS
jgi:hypothetical protein